MLKSASWLKKNFYNKDIKIIDASWYLPNSGRNAFNEYKKNHIKNAIFFDIDKISDNKSKLPHMLPTKKSFEEKVSKLGISNKDTLIIYCNEGLLSSPRVWWTFLYFGHKNVFVLDGGLKSWKNIGGQQTKGVKSFKSSYYKCKKLLNKTIIDYLKLNSVLNNKNLSFQVLDGRPEERFLQKAKEPRKNIGKGVIPMSKSSPFSLFDINGFLKNKTEIRTIFKKIIKKENYIVCSCGSGVAACNIALALASIGKINWCVYDGSWTEWYLRKNKLL